MQTEAPSNMKAFQAFLLAPEEDDGRPEKSAKLIVLAEDYSQASEIVAGALMSEGDLARFELMSISYLSDKVSTNWILIDERVYGV